MARYIDADKLIKGVQIEFDKEGVKADEFALKGMADIYIKYQHGQFCYLNAMELIKDAPAADVVPRSTIDEIFALIWDAFQSTYYDSEFEEKFDKIEKKYTEGETNDKQ